MEYKEMRDDYEMHCWINILMIKLFHTGAPPMRSNIISQRPLTIIKSGVAIMDGISWTYNTCGCDMK